MTTFIFTICLIKHIFMKKIKGNNKCKNTCKLWNVIDFQVLLLNSNNRKH